MTMISPMHAVHPAPATAAPTPPVAPGPDQLGIVAGDLCDLGHLDVEALGGRRRRKLDGDASEGEQGECGE